MDLPEPLAPTTATVVPAGTSKLTSIQNLTAPIVVKIDLLEADGAVLQLQCRRARLVFDLAMLTQHGEHALHVGERLLYLAIHDAEEIERDVELDQERIHQHEIARVIVPAMTPAAARHMIRITPIAMTALCAAFRAESEVCDRTAARSQRCIASS